MQIMLIDDHRAFEAMFHVVFPKTESFKLRYFASAIPAMQAVEAGYEPEVAFIDYDLAPGVEGSPTALGVSLHLRAASPKTRRIGFTQLHENGRTLGAVAGYEWLGDTAFLDKQSGVETLRAVAIEGAAGMPPNWRRNLDYYSRTINGLFHRPSWVHIWRVWHTESGRAAQVQSRLEQEGHRITSNEVRDFPVLAPERASAVRSGLLGEPDDPPTANGKHTPNAQRLLRFASAHSKFFEAPELETIFKVIQPPPWKRDEL